MSKYRKLIVALIGAAVAVAVQYYGKNNTTVTTVVSLLTALGVYAAPNEGV